MLTAVELFPKGCDWAYTDNGDLSDTGFDFFIMQYVSDLKGHGVEHPCYGCWNEECDVRQVAFHDIDHQYKFQPNPRIKQNIDD
jgi:hypothetical protein